MQYHPVYFTYIVQCVDGTYYTGKTVNLIQRVRQHNGNISGGARYTRIRRPVSLAYFEEHQTHTIAARREIAIKRLSHKEKEHLCQVKSESLGDII